MSGTLYQIRVATEAPSALRVELERDEPFLVIDRDTRGVATQLVDVLAGYARPTEGLIRIAGQTLVDTRAGLFVAPSRRSVGFLPAGVGLFPHLSVEENLAVGIRRMTPGIGERYERVVQTFSLAPILKLRPHDLVPREQLHGAVARAIIATSTWLLIERPDDALATEQDGLLDLLERIAEFDLPCIMTCRRDTELPKRVGESALARFSAG